MTEAFVYKWTHTPTLDWYVGYHKGSQNDGYLCSSKTVKKLIAASPADWTRVIIDEGTKDEMFELETEILQMFDACRDPRSFNRHNNHFGIAIGGWNKGLKSGPCPEHSQRMKGRTPWNKGSNGSYTTVKKGTKNLVAADNARKGAHKVSAAMKLQCICPSCGLMKTVAHARACKQGEK